MFDPNKNLFDPFFDPLKKNWSKQKSNIDPKKMENMLEDLKNVWSKQFVWSQIIFLIHIWVLINFWVLIDILTLINIWVAINVWVLVTPNDIVLLFVSLPVFFV